ASFTRTAAATPFSSRRLCALETRHFRYSKADALPFRSRFTITRGVFWILSSAELTSLLRPRPARRVRRPQPNRAHSKPPRLPFCLRRVLRPRCSQRRHRVYRRNRRVRRRSRHRLRRRSQLQIFNVHLKQYPPVQTPI